jgi:hypothetical protein
VSSIVVAHGSGLDDIAWFVVPVVGVLIALRIAERRARARSGREPGEEGDDGA